MEHKCPVCEPYMKTVATKEDRCPRCNCPKEDHRFCPYCGKQLKDFHLKFD